MFSVSLLVFSCVSAVPLVCGSGKGVTHHSACRDRVTFLCTRHRRQGHCEQDRWNKYLKNICPQSCNFCGDEACVDVNEVLCGEKREQGECQDRTPYTLHMCKKTCGFCDVRK